LAILLLGGVAASRAELQLEVFLGYDGTVREASWFPIVCEIRNDGAPFAGVIEVVPNGYGNGQVQRLAVELPTGTLKRVVIPAFAVGRFQTLWDVRLLDERGRVRGEQSALRAQRQISWETKLIGSLPRTLSGAATFLPIKRKQPDVQPASARFATALFPDNPLVLEGLDALYLNSEVAANLRASQVNAILSWLNAGGQLIVAIEQVSDVTAAPWLKQVLPVEPREVITITNHAALSDWLRTGMNVTNYAQRVPKGTKANPGLPPTVLVENVLGDLPADPAFAASPLRVATGSVREGATAVVIDGRPLIITANRGWGRVTALMFSPEREPFKSWKNLPALWTKLAEVPGRLYTSTDYQSGSGWSADGIFGAVIDSRQIHKLPVGWLLCLLLVYLLVIGPFDRWWLKRINKPMLTWITFPCYVIFFSGLIYFIGYKLRAGDSEFNELNVVDVLSNGDHTEFRGHTYVSIYSPANAKYPLRSELQFATLRGEYLARGGGQNAGKADILQTGDNFQAEVFVPVWTSQLYVYDWWNPGTKPLTASLKPTAAGWQLTVRNESSHRIETAVIVIGEKIYPVGAIPAGQSKALELTDEGGTSVRAWVADHAAAYQQAAQQRQFAFGSSGGGQITDPATASMVASFISQAAETSKQVDFVVSPGLDLSASVAHGDAVLLAWSPTATPEPPVNQFKTKRTASNTLWRIPVAINDQQ